MTLHDTKVYKPTEIEEVCNLINDFKIVKKRDTYYYNIPVSFDIEVSSFYKSTNVDDKEKVAIMYIWAFCICGYVIIGRTWKEFTDMIDKISELFETDSEYHFIIYVHNLSYEFQFIRKLFQWEKIFSLDKRKPIQAITNSGIEFRCSYMLSGYGLAKLSDQLLTYKIEKKVGDLDYTLIRHSKTPLTDSEMGYVINDVLIVVAYIQELIDKYKSIARIPLTKTGFVRNYTRNECLYDKTNYKNKDKYNKYRKLMKSLTLDTRTYAMCRSAFGGGFTHANALYSITQVIRNVDSFDECSAYPAAMCSEMFPMSSPEWVNITSEEEFYENLRYYCCIFEITFEGIERDVIYENYISASHCSKSINMDLNNGRVVRADSLTITITEQDFFIINKMYKWESMVIHKFVRFKKGYLPKSIIIAVLQLFNNKTTLKDIEGKESEYMRSKEDLNSTFGMTVTDICRDEILYEDGQWLSDEVNVDYAISKYNSSVRRFLYYPWGIYITAYARRNLFSGIMEFGEDYIYSDTDSLKVVNAHKHMAYFENYNKRIVQKLERVLDFYGLDKSLIRPKNKYGVEKVLGIWEHEKKEDETHSYKRFKTLGAKRYMYETEKGEYSLTVSGLNKKTAIPYMLEKYGDKIFDAFDNDLTIPEGYSGRTTHTYIDEPKKGRIKDYLGKTCRYEELSAVHIENSEYSLSITSQYVSYIMELLSKSIFMD